MKLEPYGRWRQGRRRASVVPAFAQSYRSFWPSKRHQSQGRLGAVSRALKLQTVRRAPPAFKCLALQDVVAKKKTARQGTPTLNIQRGRQCRESPPITQKSLCPSILTISFRFAICRILSRFFCILTRYSKRKTVENGTRLQCVHIGLTMLAVEYGEALHHAYWSGASNGRSMNHALAGFMTVRSRPKQQLARGMRRIQTGATGPERGHLTP